MDVYKPTFDDDCALLAWWLHIGETGDLESAFSKSVHRLGMFMRQFDPPVELLYAKDANGWYGVAWTWPLMDGCTYNLWLREDVRHSHVGLDFVRESLQRAFEKYPVVLYVTRSEAVLRQASRFGFTTYTAIPYFFDGDTAFVGIATPFDFESAMQPSQKDVH